MERPNFKQISDTVWEIDKKFKKGMRVPARVIASKKLLDQMEDGVFEQLTNVATLPGIQKYAIALPDSHWGYGMVIGGVAAFDLDEGIITPGGIGFDINCLSGDTRILHELGYQRPIKDFERDWARNSIKCVNPTKKVKNTSVINFLKTKPKAKVYKIKTASGRKIVATGDHPFLTRKGMVPLKNLNGEPISTFPFEGFPYKEPPNEIVVSEEDIKKILLKLGRKPGTNAYNQVLSALKRRGLLPLTFDHPKFPYLIKIAGFVFGDGWMNFIGKRGDGIVGFVGKKEDLKEIKKNLKKVGYSSLLSERTVKKPLREKVYVYKENFLHANASSLLVLFLALGVPKGTKVAQKYRILKWLFKIPPWQKRLFLAALFGAELTRPRPRPNRKGNFYAPCLQMNKRVELLENGKAFMKDISRLLADCGVRTSQLSVRGRYIGKTGNVTSSIDLVIGSAAKNLYNLWAKIGFEYHKEKAFLANIASAYLKHKLELLKKKRNAREKVKNLRKQGLSFGAIYRKIGGDFLTKRFIDSTLTRKGVSIHNDFPTFEEFVKEKTAGLGKTGQVWEEIVEKKEIDDIDYVYDFTVEDEHHNFIANNFVVSNCGVRLVLTNLTVGEVKPKIETLIDALFAQVPTGVGCRSFLKLSKKEIDEVMVKGPAWCVEKGFGLKEDLEYTEDQGKIEGADSVNVSERAVQRGLAQLGTLGSGNHYLEIQKVDKIFNPSLAQKWGILDENQVTLMVHCGSRGFGHQIATDYLRVFGQAMAKYGISVPDRQLACAPFKSKEGQAYFSAMAAAANFAFANRQLIMHRVREVLEKVFGKSAEDLGLKLIYDVAHNIAKIEEHITKVQRSKVKAQSYNAKLKAKKIKLVVHRKGATRSFPGQPVIIGGSMESGSYLLVGTEKAVEETFASTCHGSGRVMSRAKAKRQVRGDQLVKEMREKGIYVRTSSFAGLAEEAGLAYKNVSEVVDSVDRAGISKKVASFVPIGNIKG